MEYEADPRQAERLISECGLDGSKAMSTPGVRETAKEVAEEPELESKLNTPSRGAAARSNYLSADLCDMQFEGSLSLHGHSDCA